MEKPANVLLAVTLLWASIAIGIVRSALVLVEAADKGTFSIFGACVLTLTFLSLTLITFRISSGSNKARIAYLLLFISGCVKILPDLTDIIQASIVMGVVVIFQTAIQFVVLFLIFTKPGSDWFNGTIHSKAFDSARQNRQRY